MINCDLKSACRFLDDTANASVETVRKPKFSCSLLRSLLRMNAGQDERDSLDMFGLLEISPVDSVHKLDTIWYQ